MNNQEINKIIKEELKYLIQPIEQFKQDRMIGQAVSFDWKLINTINETRLEFNLESYNPIRMQFEFNLNDMDENCIKKACKRYTSLLLRQTIFGR
tara:strand:- start:177 stop:461 length:285 start_codon:yes stop_codon:yes gene_type:complete